MNIVVSICHAAHLPERKPVFQRLVGQLGDTWPVHVISDKLPPHEWSVLQWGAAMNHPGATHGLFLNDDVVLCDNFHEILEQVIAAYPNDVISLYASDPKSAKVRSRYYSSRDGLIGNAYVIPVPLLEKFSQFRQVDLMPFAKTHLSEDQQVNLFCMANGLKIRHTVPSLVDHDVTVVSTAGVQWERSQPARKAVVPPQPDMHRMYWGPQQTPHLGRFFKGNHWYLLKAIHPSSWQSLGCVDKFYQYCREMIHDIEYVAGPSTPIREWDDIPDLGDDDYQKHLSLVRYRWAASCVRPGAIIAHCGCGTNYGSPMLRAAGAHRVVGIDSGVAQKQINDERGYGEMCVADLELLELEGFDTMVCLETLEHLQDPQGWLKRISPDVKDFIISVPIVPTKHRNQFHKHDLQRDQVRGWLQDIGCQILDERTQDDPYWVPGGQPDMVGMFFGRRT